MASAEFNKFIEYVGPEDPPPTNGSFVQNILRDYWFTDTDKASYRYELEYNNELVGGQNIDTITVNLLAGKKYLIVFVPFYLCDQIGSVVNGQVPVCFPPLVPNPTENYAVVPQMAQVPFLNTFDVGGSMLYPNTIPHIYFYDGWLHTSEIVIGTKTYVVNRDTMHPYNIPCGPFLIVADFSWNVAKDKWEIGFPVIRELAYPELYDYENDNGAEEITAPNTLLRTFYTYYLECDGGPICIVNDGLPPTNYWRPYETRGNTGYKKAIIYRGNYLSLMRMLAVTPREKMLDGIMSLFNKPEKLPRGNFSTTYTWPYHPDVPELDGYKSGETQYSYTDTSRQTHNGTQQYITKPVSFIDHDLLTSGGGGVAFNSNHNVRRNTTVPWTFVANAVTFFHSCNRFKSRIKHSSDYQFPVWNHTPSSNYTTSFENVHRTWYETITEPASGGFTYTCSHLHFLTGGPGQQGTYIIVTVQHSLIVG
jgi:hypothetical protein